ncbi:hypothetical protein LCGC14_2178430 [marine sediment metagenome]|uniref:Uncharacterized protein n=1 Tax=marine sediment metagenome TaxID=412755 RepID=A0A0F9DMZ3_9ZZZZ
MLFLIFERAPEYCLDCGNPWDLDTDRCSWWWCQWNSIRLDDLDGLRPGDREYPRSVPAQAGRRQMRRGEDCAWEP